MNDTTNSLLYVDNTNASYNKIIKWMESIDVIILIERPLHGTNWNKWKICCRKPFRLCINKLTYTHTHTSTRAQTSPSELNLLQLQFATKHTIQPYICLAFGSQQHTANASMLSVPYIHFIYLRFFCSFATQ